MPEVQHQQQSLLGLLLLLLPHHLPHHHITPHQQPPTWHGRTHRVCSHSEQAVAAALLTFFYQVRGRESARSNFFLHQHPHQTAKQVIHNNRHLVLVEHVNHIPRPVSRHQRFTTFYFSGITSPCLSIFTSLQRVEIRW